MHLQPDYHLTKNLPSIPDKRYFTISEVAELCQLKPHVLRYWEQEFPELAPTKRKGNRRYYQVQDIQLIRKIRELLYEKGFTLQGASAQLKPKQQTLIASNDVVKSLIQDLKSLKLLLEPAD